MVIGSTKYQSTEIKSNSYSRCYDVTFENNCYLGLEKSVAQCLEICNVCSC